MIMMSRQIQSPGHSITPTKAHSPVISWGCHCPLWWESKTLSGAGVLEKEHLGRVGVDKVLEPHQRDKMKIPVGTIFLYMQNHSRAGLTGHGL